MQREKDVDGWRVYKDEGEIYYSVTQVLEYFVDQKLKSWFIKNSANAIEKKKTETAQTGSDIHQQAHEGNEMRLNTLITDLGMKKIKSEWIVKSKNGWAGQPDLKVEWKGKNYILDIKTGSFGHVALQLAAYTLADNENGGDVTGNGVISLPRDITQPATFWEYSEHMEENQYAWACAFDTWKHHYFKKLKYWKQFETKTVLSYNWSFK